jgi:hypothetical protein
MSDSQSRERKFRIALLLYGILAVAVWFSFGGSMVFAFGWQIELRWIPLVVIGSFAFRTYIAREADKIRRSGEDEAGKL